METKGEGLAMPKLLTKVHNEFERGFQRSRNGNLTRVFDGLRLTVFPRADGWGWCIAYADGGRRFSECPHDTEQEALDSLAVHVGVTEPLPELD
jgi:hypothetical protein